MRLEDLLPPPAEGDHQLFRNIALLKIEFCNPATGDIYKAEATCFTLATLKKNWLITNRHCLDVHFGIRKGKGLVLTRLSVTFPGPKQGNKFYEFACDLDSIEFLFCDHADIAAIPSESLTPVGEGGYATYNLYMDIVGKSTIYDNLHVGSEVMFVGYPAGLWDMKNHLPILRNATLSSIPAYDYAIGEQNDEPRVLVSGMSLGGNSGSPVFFQTRGPLILIGIMSGHYFSDATSQWTAEIADSQTTESVESNRKHTGLSYFIKASLLHEIEKWSRRTRHG